MNIIEDMMKLNNTQIDLLNSLETMTYVLNTQCLAHHNKMA